MQTHHLEAFGASVVVFLVSAAVAASYFVACVFCHQSYLLSHCLTQVQPQHHQVLPRQRSSYYRQTNKINELPIDNQPFLLY
jgi:hypothetical protein